MKKKIKTILIGLGNIGMECDLNNDKIISHSKAILKDPRLEFCCAVDVDLKKIKKFEARYKIKGLTNLNNALKIYKPHLLVIAIKNNNVKGVFEKIKKHESIKYIILEKPGAKNYRELKKIIKLTSQRKIKLFINYNRTYQEKYLDIFKEYRKAKFFKSTFFYNRGFYNNCSHFINILFQFLNKKKKIEIINKGKNWNNDIQPDVIFRYKKGEIIFINSVKKNITNNQFILISNNKKYVSDSYFGNIESYKLSNNIYILEEKINMNHSITQKITLNKILKYIEQNSNIRKLSASYLDTIEVLDKVKKLNTLRK